MELGEKIAMVMGFLLGILAMASYNYIYVMSYRIKTGEYK